MILTITIAFLLSLFIWGFHWPIDWVNNLLHANVTSRIVQDANIGLFPYGLVFWLRLFIPMPRKDKSLYIASATITSLTYVGTYSLILLLGFAVPWWAYILSSVPYVFGTNGFWITSLVPIFLMIWLIIKNTRLNQYIVSFNHKVHEKILLLSSRNNTN